MAAILNFQLPVTSVSFLSVVPLSSWTPKMEVVVAVGILYQGGRPSRTRDQFSMQWYVAAILDFDSHVAFLLWNS